MKNSFSGYYLPTQDEYKKIWEEGTIILDTNVLLDLYRLPKSTREELFSLITLVGNRVWIPYQVALEFQKRRLSVISAERKIIEDASASANTSFEEVRKRVLALQIDRRELGVEIENLITNLKFANDKVIEALDIAYESQLDVSTLDPIRDRIDSILEGKVGSPPENQKDLDLTIEDGEERYLNKIPPGFMDADKEKNPTEATFYHDGLKYQRKFGDLIVWKQIINYVKKNDIKSVLLITSDRKEDWWWKEKGRTIGPRSELTREIINSGNAELFWMYSPSQFLENSKSFVHSIVSDQAIIELQQISQAPSFDIQSSDQTSKDGNSNISINSIFRKRSSTIDFAKSEEAVFNWLKKKYDNVRMLRTSFPDFIVETETGLRGYEVKHLRYKIGRVDPFGSIEAFLLMTLNALQENVVSFLSLIIIINEHDLSTMRRLTKQKDVGQYLQDTVNSYIIDEIILGFVTRESFFIELTTKKRDTDRSLPDWGESE